MNLVASSLNDQTTITAKSVANCGLARMRRAMLQAMLSNDAGCICTNERTNGRTHELTNNPTQLPAAYDYLVTRTRNEPKNEMFNLQQPPHHRRTNPNFV
jgi:hypothetical protein